MKKLNYIEQVYAESAFYFARDTQKILQWKNMLKKTSEIFEYIYKKNVIFHKFLEKKIFYFFLGLLKNNFDKNFINFLKIIFLNKKLFFIKNIFICFCNIYQKFCKKEINLYVTTSRKLNNKILENINNIIQEKILKKTKLICKIDKNIIGGIIIKYENFVINASIKNYLDKLLKVLVK
ncbi:ATP synthase F1 subunit delta [Buchnera aphidicola (Taiwanaphis decaspermi)]|uniref:ATP synthase F1 subunit delta n=1 Tax=Buchnera aphidicola TaxID=9 RepID=UPI0031B87D4C